ncbi:MAG: GDP-L-fucose synthase [Pseudomonadota bacterium]
MHKNSKIYLAGHDGLVGSAIFKKLKESGFEKIVYKNISDLDLRRQDECEAFFAVEKPEYVILAAAKVGGILANNTYKAEFIYDNLMIAANVINSSYKFGVKKLLNLGSSCIYPKLAPQPLKEEYLLTDLLEPTNEPYAIAKIAAIKMCRYYNEQYGTNYISLMPTNLFGPFDNYNLNTSHVLPAIIRKLHLGNFLLNNDFDAIRNDFIKHPMKDIKENGDDNYFIELLASFGIFKDHIMLWGTGCPYREFLFSEDLAEAVLFLLNNYNSSDINEIINVGYGKDITIAELASTVKNIVEYNGQIKWDKTKPDGTPKKLLDTSKINSLGWKARHNLKEGIKKAYEAYCV